MAGDWTESESDEGVKIHALNGIMQHKADDCTVASGCAIAAARQADIEAAAQSEASSPDAADASRGSEGRRY